MPLDVPLPERVRALNARYKHHGATTVLGDALRDPALGRIAMVSSFGSESVALLHLVAVIDRHLPVLFIDTEMLFPETLVYQSELAVTLGLTHVRVVRARLGDTLAADPAGDLHRHNPDACCDLRKTEPLQRALSGFDAWITGRKRYQGGQRTALDFFEIEAGMGRIKINPLAHWTSEDVGEYIDANRLPRHPLVKAGYPSIGCAPCTSQVAAGEDARAGRWRGQAKDECGIHFVDGKIVRGSGASAA